MPKPALAYSDLVLRYGAPAAYSLLLEVERLARVASDPSNLVEEARLERALIALNQIDFSD